MKLIVFLLGWVAMLSAQPVYAAKKDNASAKAISKLQMMVKDATAERDRLKTENATISAELAQVKKQLEQEKTAKIDLEAQLNSELAAQKSSVEQTKSHLDNTTAKLREVIDKYNALNKSKNELAAEHLKLQNDQQFTSSELKACEHKNLKMFEGAKEIIAGYESCQNKGFLDSLIDSEPLTKINNVEFETIIQEYEDKLRKQKFQSTIDTRKQ